MVFSDIMTTVTRVPLHWVNNYCTRLETLCRRRPAPNSKTISQLRISGHAHRRGSQRNVTPDQIEYVVRHGRVYRGHGAAHYFFGRKERQKIRDNDHKWADRLEGIVVVTDPDRQTVKTIYRNRDAPRALRKKAA